MRTHARTCAHTNTHTHTHTHAHAHTHARTHAHTLRRLRGAKDNVASLKYMKRGVVFLKEDRVAECLMSCLLKTGLSSGTLKRCFVWQDKSSGILTKRHYQKQSKRQQEKNSRYKFNRVWTATTTESLQKEGNLLDLLCPKDSRQQTVQTELSHLALRHIHTA